MGKVDNPRSSRRVAWFDLGAKALQFLEPRAPDCYVCPLCIRAFTRNAVATRVLTTEHVPPESLGGRRLVLTCQDCNSRAGAEVDSQMLALEQIYNFAAGTMRIPMRARLKVGGETLNIETLATAKSVLAFVLPRNNDPRRLASAEAELARLAEEGQGYQGQMTFYEDVRYRPALVGWLRAAYLAAFAALGYRYILRRELEIVRAQLADTTRDVLQVFSVTVPTAPSNERRILVVEQPEWLRSLSVQMGRHVVFLPGFPATPDLYESLASQARHHQRLDEQVAGKLLPWPTKPQLSLDFPQTSATSPPTS